VTTSAATWARPDSERLQVILRWLSAVIAGRPASLAPVDDEMVRLLGASRLAPLAAAQGVSDPAITRMAARGFRRGAITERASSRVVQILAAAGVPCVTLKGPALASAYWGDIALRPSVDVDVLVAPADVERADAALVGAGLTRSRMFPDWFQREWQYHLTYRLTDPAVTIELHWSVTSRELGALPVAEMLATAVDVACDATVLPALDPGWQFVVAAVHAFGHDCSLREILDVGFIAAHLDAAGWTETCARVRKTSLGGVVYHAAAASSERLEWSLPACVAALRPRHTRIVRRYLDSLPMIGPITWRQLQIGRVVKPLASGSLLAWALALPRSLSRRPFLARRLDRLVPGRHAPGR
jgi:hypothetical protein